MKNSVFVIALALFATAGSAQTGSASDSNTAPDYAREKRWADEISPGLVVGDAVYLAQKQGHKFLAIYTQATQPRAAVIVVHGMGVHPDWALIGALRSGLADQGYSTLSVQMPVRAANGLAEEYPGLFPDAAERLQAAVDFLKSKGYGRIALVSHSMGARMSNYFLARSPGGIDAWVAIGISNGEFMNAAQLHTPIFDVYGERDFPPVLQKAGARETVLKKSKGSAQMEVAGADHYFAGKEAELVKQVRQFLDRLFH
jgi:alpha/beta superfamily hydrolase